MIFFFKKMQDKKNIELNEIWVVNFYSCGKKRNTNK